MKDLFDTNGLALKLALYFSIQGFLYKNTKSSNVQRLVLELSNDIRK